jgi:Fic family protein
MSWRETPLRDRSGRPFVVGLPDRAQELLHRIDMALGSRSDVVPLAGHDHFRDRYIISSLMEEAITSSQLEGASTTRVLAQDMLRSGRRPADKSERMIYNNYAGMRWIREQGARALTPDMVRTLHRILSAGTLSSPEMEGRMQQASDIRVHVVDNIDGSILHAPPDASELPARLHAMCEFANQGLSDQRYLHPVVRAIILHFWLAYDHPFEDGNGRTARALFYWGMLNQKYWLAEFLTISNLIYAAPGKYRRAFLHTETDDNDLTYFVLHQLEIIDRAIDNLRGYIQRKTQQHRELDRMLRDGSALNHRQRALLTHALRNPKHVYDIESHRRSHDVAYATARADLLQLAKLGLLQQRKNGRTLRFQARLDLEQRLSQT